MKTLKFVVCFMAIMIAGSLIGFTLGWNEIEISIPGLIFAGALVLLISILVVYNKLIVPVGFIMKGEYNKAIERFQKRLLLFKKNSAIRNTILLNIAICHNRMGNFNQSIEFLDKVDFERMDKNLKWGCLALYAVNLLLLGRDMKTIGPYIEKLWDYHSMTDFFPVLSYYEILKGNKDKAIECIEEYTVQKVHKKALGIFFIALTADTFTYEIENNFFIGLSYISMNQLDSAIPYFQISENCDYENYYSRKSKEVLGQIKTTVSPDA